MKRTEISSHTKMERKSSCGISVVHPIHAETHSQDSVIPITDALSRYYDRVITKLTQKGGCTSSKVESRRRWMCFLQAHIAGGLAEAEEFKRVFNIMENCEIPSLTRPLEIAFNGDYTVVEILEEYAGERMIDQLRKKEPTLEQKNEIYAQILAEGAMMIHFAKGNYFHGNIGPDVLLEKYGRVRLAYGCFGKRCSKGGELTKDTKLPLLEEQFAAPEIIARREENKGCMDIVFL